MRDSNSNTDALFCCTCHTTYDARPDTQRVGWAYMWWGIAVTAFLLLLLSGDEHNVILAIFSSAIPISFACYYHSPRTFVSCPACGATEPIPTSSPRAQQTLAEKR